MSYLGEICGLATALLWSGSSVMFSRAANMIGSVNLNIIRLFLADIMIIITLIVFRISIPATQWQIIFLSLSGIIGLIFGDSFLFKSYKHNSPRISMLVMSISPAITAIFAYFIINEDLTSMAVIGMFITTVGIAMVLLEKHQGEKISFDFTGIFYAFLAAVGQAGGLIFARLAFNIGNLNGLAAALIRISAALVLFLPLVIILKRFVNPLKLLKRDNKALTYTLVGSIFGPYLGITLSMLSVMYTEIAIASTLMSIVPIPLLVFGKIFDKENISLRAVFGTFIAVAGVAILFLR